MIDPVGRYASPEVVAAIERIAMDLEWIDDRYVICAWLAEDHVSPSGEHVAPGNGGDER